MSDVRTCLACGAESRDVAMRLVEVEPDEQRVVQAAIPTAEDRHGVKGFDYVDVREHWIAEPRCRDQKGCRARVVALEPIAEPVAHVEPVAVPAVNSTEAEADMKPSWMRPG